MFAMICTDNLRYKKTKYYDSEYVIKGTLHINEHAYAFSHYDGAFEVLGIRWLSNYTKGRYSKDTGLEFSGANTANLAAHDMPLETAVSESESRAAHRTRKRRARIGQGCQRMPEHLQADYRGPQKGHRGLCE